MALDRFGRRIHYLRISLTDRCNLRCVYCMPESRVFRPKSDLMQDDEILFFTRLFARLGFDKIRLTGGEPTLRPNLVNLVEQIAQTPGIRTITMTTNGVLLKNLAEPLAKAGLQRVNISLDTLDSQLFSAITQGGSLDDVWEGIRAAEEAGLTPVKINAVVLGDCNDKEIAHLANLTLTHPWQVRFIETMPFAGPTEMQCNQIVKANDIKTQIEASLGQMDAVNGGELDGEARLYRLPGALGNLGFIASVSQPFCASCTRTRLTADGHLRLCLLRENEVDLLTPLRAGASMDDLRQMILEAIWNKPWGHGLSSGEIALNRTMSQIGG